MTDSIQCEGDERPPDPSVLWRGVPFWPRHIVEDKNTGTFKVSSAAFDDPEMSVVVSEEAESPDDLVNGRDNYGVVSFLAGYARHDMNQEVKHDAWPAEPSHALVLGTKSTKMRRQLASRIKWVRRPPDYDAENLPDPTPIG